MRTLTFGPRCAGALLVLAAVGAGACSGATASSASPGAVPVPASVPTASRADVEFMTAMIHHHAQALVMADLAATRAESPAIRRLSERIRVSQTDEIALIQLWLQDYGEPVPAVPEVGIAGTAGDMDHHHHHGHEMQMPGMLTPGQIAEMGGATGSEFDRLFLTNMIQHHEGALVMVETLFASYGGGVEDFVYKFASDTFADQGSEIDRMQNMLDDLLGSDPR